MITTDKEVRHTLSRLNATVLSMDVAIQQAEADRRAEEANREALAARLDKARTERAQAQQEATEAAADVLVANPKASIGSAFLARITGTKAEPAATVAALKLAVDKAANKVRKRGEEIEALKAERDAAWRAFAEATYAAGMAETERRLLALHDEVTAPMRALLPSVRNGGGPRFVGSDLRVEVTWYANEADTMSRKTRLLVPRMEPRTFGGPQPLTRSEPVDGSPYLERLRAELRGERG